MDVLEQGLNRPYQLVYYKKNHEIFFSNNVGNFTEDKFEIRRLHVAVGSNITNVKVDNVENGFAVAIDNENDAVYFGGSDGVHKYDLKEDKLEKIINNHDIWDMFFKKHLYFITYPGQRLYKYSDFKRKHSKGLEWKDVHEKFIHERIYQFAIDKDDDVFITNDTGLFMIKNGTEHRRHITGETVFRCIELNNEGEAHFCGKNAIFVVHKETHTLNEIVYVKNIFGLTFDNAGHIIYSNPTKIVKLTPSLCKILNGIVMYEPLPLPKVLPKPAKT
ncbi:ommochrome-binding protein-like [Hyposmocoma kahamanoa]|uniref:ommochrome-binding protein-like n=1 Tax=Hyposmocoma kahamanoa TaxID=1477025 RepID=UPI000E6D8C20|nr:ommochrome-binding protein-like [Hyposmocoma kahamanoa]